MPARSEGVANVGPDPERARAAPAALGLLPEQGGAFAAVAHAIADAHAMLGASVFNRRVAESVAEAVATAAVASGVARRRRDTAAHEPATPLEVMP